MCNPFSFDLMTICLPRVEQFNSKKGNNYSCKYSYLQGKSGISRVLTSEYKVMTGCLKLFAWSHNLVPWYQIRLYKLKKVLWTQNSVQNIGKIDNLQPKCLPFFGVELLHCRLTDFHQVTAKRVPNTVTYSNLSPVAIFINITGEQYLLTNYKRHQEAERDATTKDFDYKCNTRFVRNIPENQKQHKKCCCVKYYGISDYSKIVDTCLNLRLLGFLCSLHYFYRFYERIFTDELSTTLSLSRVC